MRKKLLKALIVCMLFTMPVNAAKMINCDISADGVVTIEQKLPSSKEGAGVSIIVYNQGKSASDITDDNNALVSVIETNQTVSGKEGMYSFSFNITGESDFYTAHIFSAVGDAEEYSFLYSKPDKAKLLLEELNNAGSNDEFFKVIYGEDGQGEKWKDLGFYYSSDEKADARKVSDLLFLDVKENGKFNTDDAEDAIKRFRQVSVLQLLNEGKNVSADEADKYFDDVLSVFSEYYSKEYINAQVKSEIYKGLLNQSLKGKTDFKNKFLKQLILKTVLYADGYGNIRDILKAFETETGISTSGLGSENYKNVIGNVYADYDKLKEALNKKTTTGGGGGGGGGSTSSKGKDNSIIGGSIDYAQELVETETVKPVTENKKHKFTDIENLEWAEDAIVVLAENGVINGKSDSVFAPLDLVTREEFAAMIVRALNIKGMSENPFADVADDAWYAPFIKTAVNNSIINGVDGTNFGVGQNITRQDVATIISRAKKSETTITDKFLDDALISDYAKDAVYAMYSENIISGYETGEFRPKNFATRAEAAVMLWRAFYR